MKENGVVLSITSDLILIPFVIKYLNAFNSIVVPEEHIPSVILFTSSSILVRRSKLF